MQLSATNKNLKAAGSLIIHLHSSLWINGVVLHVGEFAWPSRNSFIASFFWGGAPLVKQGWHQDTVTVYYSISWYKLSVLLEHEASPCFSSQQPWLPLTNLVLLPASTGLGVLQGVSTGSYFIPSIPSSVVSVSPCCRSSARLHLVSTKSEFPPWCGTSSLLARSSWIACKAGSGIPLRWKMQTTEQYLGPFWAVSSLSIKTKNPLHDLQLKTMKNDKPSIQLNLAMSAAERQLWGVGKPRIWSPMNWSP